MIRDIFVKLSPCWRFANTTERDQGYKIMDD